MMTQTEKNNSSGKPLFASSLSLLWKSGTPSDRLFLSTTIDSRCFGPERCHRVTLCVLCGAAPNVHPRCQIGGSILAIPFAQMLHKICLWRKFPSWEELETSFFLSKFWERIARKYEGCILHSQCDFCLLQKALIRSLYSWISAVIKTRNPKHHRQHDMRQHTSSNYWSTGFRMTSWNHNLIHAIWKTVISSFFIIFEQDSSISLASADLIDHASTLLGILDDGLCAHASALSGKVDALTWRWNKISQQTWGLTLPIHFPHICQTNDHKNAHPVTFSHSFPLILSHFV